MLFECVKQNLLVEPVGFAHLSFDAITIDSMLKVAFRHADHHLCGWLCRCALSLHIYYAQRKGG